MRIKILILFAAIFVLAGGIYFYYFSGPSHFLTDDKIKENITDYYSISADTVEIQDIVFLDEKHVFVPFRFNQHYGSSFWVWEKRRWEIGEIDTIQTPKLWKVQPDDPESYVFTWNMMPDNGVHEVRFFLLNRRNYFVSDGIHHYTPRAQMQMRVFLDSLEKSYGVVPIPEDWVAYLEDYHEVEASKQPSSLFTDFFPHSSVYFAWRPYDEDGNDYHPQIPNGNGHGTGKVHTEYLGNVDDYELE